MARSSYVYVLARSPSAPPLACFTVKREALDWMDRTKPLGDVTLYRYRDNPRPALMASALATDAVAWWMNGERL